MCHTVTSHIYQQILRARQKALNKVLCIIAFHFKALRYCAISVNTVILPPFL